MYDETSVNALKVMRQLSIDMAFSGVMRGNRFAPGNRLPTCLGVRKILPRQRSQSRRRNPQSRKDVRVSEPL